MAALCVCHGYAGGFAGAPQAYGNVATAEGVHEAPAPAVPAAAAPAAAPLEVPAAAAGAEPDHPDAGVPARKCRPFISPPLSFSVYLLLFFFVYLSLYFSAECVICLAAIPTYLFLSCKHCCLCPGCYVTYPTKHFCPVCRTPATRGSIVRIYFV